MLLLQFLAEFAVVLVRVLIAWTISIVQFFLPTSIIGKDVKGQTVLITGSGGGIGSLVAQKFASLGCNLVLWDINPTLNDKTACEARTKGVNVRTYTVDLSDKEAIYSTAEQVERDVGRVDIVFNNAGIVTGKKVTQAPDKAMELTVKVNTLSHFWMAKAFLNQMIRRNEGHLVTMASSAGLIGVSGMADYCASKFANIGFEESLRMELKSRPDNNVKTTIICPYHVKTPMFEGCHSKYPFIMDGLEPEYVANKAVDAVLRNQEIVCMPKQIYVLAALKQIIPAPVNQILNDFFGVTNFMDPFVGRNKQS